MAEQLSTFSYDDFMKELEVSVQEELPNILKLVEAFRYVPNKKKGPSKFKQTKKISEESNTRKSPQELRDAAERAAEDSRKMAKNIQVIPFEERQKIRDVNNSWRSKGLSQAGTKDDNFDRLRNNRETVETEPTEESAERAAEDSRKMAKNIQVIPFEERQKIRDVNNSWRSKGLSQAGTKDDNFDCLRNNRETVETEPAEESFTAWSMKRMGERSS